MKRGEKGNKTKYPSSFAEVKSLRFSEKFADLRSRVFKRFSLLSRVNSHEPFVSSCFLTFINYLSMLRTCGSSPANVLHP